MNKLVSIIIPNYNRADLITETLESILNQTYTNWECIIVDDGSTDNSKETIQRFVDKDIRFQLHDRPNNLPKGANTCRNYGFNISNGEYINWFDSDDVMLPTFLEEKINKFTNEIELVICSGALSDFQLKIIKKIELDVKTTIFKDYVTWKLKILTPSVLFRKSFLEDRQLFSNKIKRGQESELFSRFFFQLGKNKYYIINKPLFLYRQHQDTKTHKNKTYVKSYHESLTYNVKENLKRSIKIKDKELIRIFSHSLIIYYKKGLINKHFRNSIFAISQLIFITGKYNPIFLLKILMAELLINPAKVIIKKILNV